jgi:hypothetical protein
LHVEQNIYMIGAGTGDQELVENNLEIGSNELTVSCPVAPTRAWRGKAGGAQQRLAVLV